MNRHANESYGSLAARLAREIVGNIVQPARYERGKLVVPLMASEMSVRDARSARTAGVVTIDACYACSRVLSCCSHL